MKGLIAKKIGMTRVFREDGMVVPVTQLRVEPNTVVRLRTKEKDGYDAVVLGIGGDAWKTRKGKEHTRYRKMKEFVVDSLDGMQIGMVIGAEILPPESIVTITGVSKGKGFQGVVKRHGFAGGPKTHGSHFKREPGSVGMRNKPGKIFKGHRMAGRMGGDRITLKHRLVVSSDPEHSLIMISGAIPGAKGGVVYVTVEQRGEETKDAKETKESKDSGETKATSKQESPASSESSNSSISSNSSPPSP